MRRAPPCLGVQIGIDRRMVEQSQFEFHAQDGRDGTVQSRRRKRAVFNAGDNCVLENVVFEIVELHVYAGVQRQRDGRLRIWRHSVLIDELADCAEVRENESFEPPLLAQNVEEQHGIGRARYPINLVVGSHHSHRMRIADGGLERL